MARKKTAPIKVPPPGMPEQPFSERRRAHMIHDPMRVVFSTAPAAEAEKLARMLVEERLVACTSLIKDVSSVYWWQGKIETSAETMLVMKTPASKINALRRRLKEVHSYTIPEFLALQVMEVNQ